MAYDEIVVKLNKGKEAYESMAWKKYCIYRVPRSLKQEELDKDYIPYSQQISDQDYIPYSQQTIDKNYVPKVVSLGPYHHGDPKLKDMELHKWRALYCMLNRNKQDIGFFLRVIKSIEQDARACYEGLSLSEASFPTRDAFVEMLLLDGCFILEILLSFHRSEFPQLGYEDDDPVFSKGYNYLKSSILRDMLLLENQIPLLVLNRLYENQPNRLTNKSVVDLVLKIFTPLCMTERNMASYKPVMDELKRSRTLVQQHISEMLHCLDIFRRSLIYCSFEDSKLEIQGGNNNSGGTDQSQMIPSATAMKEAGVTFKMKKTLPFWAIKPYSRMTIFCGEVLEIEIPQILIHDDSEATFLNLIAFEQCHYYTKPRECKIISYVYLMDNLVNSPSDVAELCDKGIIVHTLSSDQAVADFFNRLVKGVNFDVEDSFFAELYNQINAYCDKGWNKSLANLRHNYFNTPWSTIAVIAAALGLLLTAMQTAYALADFYKPDDKEKN